MPGLHGIHNLLTVRVPVRYRQPAEDEFRFPHDWQLNRIDPQQLKGKVGYVYELMTPFGRGRPYWVANFDGVYGSVYAYPEDWEVVEDGCKETFEVVVRRKASSEEEAIALAKEAEKRGWKATATATSFHRKEDLGVRPLYPKRVAKLRLPKLRKSAELPYPGTR